MKKIIMGLGMLMLTAFAQGQNGLENIIVEKYYVSNAADATGSVGTLPAGSVTYRVYADLLPNYKFQALYGISTHTLTISTSTTFFNNEDRGATNPNGISVVNTRKNSVMIDSWFSVGATAAGKMGVLKTEDTDGSIGNADGMLLNADTSAGIPINGAGSQDGMTAGTPEAVSFVGLTSELNVFDATSQQGSLFLTTNGSIASLNGSTGPTSTNRVLIGQFTTDGVFGFELNIQIGTPSGGTQNYVARNPVGAEISIPSLRLAPNQTPKVNITSPANGAQFVTGDIVNITATASDTDGTVSSVQFFVDGSSIGTDNVAPYTAAYTSAVGTHSLTAKATDNQGAVKTSTVVAIIVGNNTAPTVSVSAPSTAVVGDNVTISATAGDVDGTISSVEFFVNGGSIGTDNSAPYTMNWTAVLGVSSLTAKATDDRTAQTTSSPASITVAANIPPSVSITAPTTGSAFTAPQVVTITANANDPDGTVTQVEFFVNGGSIGIDNSAPYSVDWVSVIGSANLTAKATDDKSTITTSAGVLIDVADPNALPYKVVSTVATCLPNSFCIPVKAMDTVANVIGYDVVLNYDNAKVTPTGNVTVFNTLINPTWVDVVNSIDGANGLMNISIYFNSSAPGNANFYGIGNLFCVEFNKTAGFNSVDNTTIDVSSLQESYFVGVSAKLVQSGDYTTYRDTVFNGSLKFWSDNSPIKYNSANPNDYVATNIYGNNVTCNNQSATAVQPDLSGNFVYSLNNGLDINLEKDILSGTDVQPVVNGFDAFLVRKVLVNDASFIPSAYQMLAMDVNLDGAVSAGDVSQINQRAVLMIPEFKQAWNYNAQGVSDGRPSKDWKWIDSTSVSSDPSYVISGTYPGNDGIGFSKSRVPVIPFCLEVPVADFATCPLISSETYRGILVGDINGNYASVNGGPNSFKQGGNDKVVFDVAHAVTFGNYIDVPVSIVSANPVNALDFAMITNENNIVYNSIIDNTTYLQSLANYNSGDNTLRFTSNSLQNYDLTKSQVSVRFSMNVAQVSVADFISTAAYLNGDKVNVEFLGAATGTTDISGNTNQINIYPNPAKDVLNVTADENSYVQILDATGKQIFVQLNVYANQKQEIGIQNLANGVYIVKVYNENFVAIRRVVVSH